MQWLLALLGMFVALALLVCLWIIPEWQLKGLQLDLKDRADLVNEYRRTLAQIIGGLGLIVGIYFTWRQSAATEYQLHLTEQQVRVTEQGQLTDRFTKAITQLGDSKIEIRLGGIYALERIARDSPSYHWPVMEVLTAYVRQHAPWPSHGPVPQPIPYEDFRPPGDIQAIMTVIGRRITGDQREVNVHLDLSNTDLRGVRLVDANFEWADFHHSALQLADFERVNVHGAIFIGAKVQGALLSQTNLTQIQLESMEGDPNTSINQTLSRPKFWK